MEALRRSVVSEFESYVKLNKKFRPRSSRPSRRSTTMAKLADTVASHLAVKIADKQAMLENARSRSGSRKCLALMESEISVLQVEKRIRTRVKRQMEKTQREYYLNEQMKAIQKELGDEDGKDDLAELEERIKRQAVKEARDKATGRAEEAPADVADVGGSDRRAQLSRLAPVHPVEQAVQDQEGSRRRARDARRPTISAWIRSRSESSSISRCSSAPIS